MGVMELRHDDQRVVCNRNGHLLINPQGQVDSTHIDDGVEDFTGHFRHITRVDLDEWRKHWKEEPPNELDILDVAYWFRNPGEEQETYQPADQNWRAEVDGRSSYWKNWKPT
jgi:hypothetical protein